MGFTIEDKAFLLDCFRNGVKQGNGDSSSFIAPCIEEFQARYPTRWVLIIMKLINVSKL
jgi:hypothetical protein